MRIFRRAVTLSLPLWLSACAVQGPPASVATTLPSQWQARLPHQGHATELSTWWAQLRDPLLVSLVEAAQEVSPTLASARGRLEQARAARVGAASAMLPGLQARAEAVRGNAQPPGVLAGTAQVGTQMAWELDLFGGLRAATDAAQARLQGAQAGWHEARVSVAAETASSYVGLRACERQLEVARSDARSRAETARLTQLSADAGLTAPATGALARASAAEGAARLTQQGAQCQIELKALVALTGLDEPALRARLAAAAPGQAPEPPESSQVIASLPAQVLAQRPDVYQAELAVVAASGEAAAAQAARYPRITLAGSIAAGAVRADGGSTDAQTWSLGPLAVSLPLFDAGRRAADAQAAQARYDEAVVLYRARLRQAVSEVEQALVSLDSARSRNADAQEAAQGFRLSFQAIEARYRAGLSSLLELEDARRSLLAAEIALVGLQRERLTAWITLYRAAGGGWQREANSLAATPRP